MNEMPIPISLTIHDPMTADLIFNTSNCKEIIRLTSDGDIYVKGKLIENDKELVQGLREFFLSTITNK